jgi:hypothetical protein
MADIIVNDNQVVKGKMTITRTLDIAKEPPVLTIVGQLETHRYFEEITVLETERYIVKGITVVQESFGSEDFNVVYTFMADSLEVRGGETNLSDEDIEAKEKELYGGEK